MDRYIERKLNDYLYELSTSEFAINKWRKLELITAYKNKSLLYEDVPEYIKEKYDLPTRDEGIDVVKLNNETIIETYQCKDYEGYVSNHSLGTYFAFHLYKLIGIPFNIVGSNNSVFNSMVTPIIYDTNEIFNHGLIIDNENNILKKLRWYQKEAIELIEKAFFESINEISNVNEVRIKIPCGCGKTALMYYFGMSNLNILILVPKINIAEQIQDYFEDKLKKKCNCYWTEVNIKNNSNITICVYNSVEHVVNNNYDIIFIDEAHHIVGSKLYKYYDYSEDDYMFKEPKSDYKSFIPRIQNLNSILKVYLSATIDVKNIENSYELQFDKAIEEEYLSDYEFNILYVDPEFDDNYNQLVEIINDNKEYKHIILYRNRIETANYINGLLNSNNIISSVVTSEESRLKRNKTLDNFRDGLIKVICSVNCLNEGTDLPIADTCMFVNDRGSEINIIQCIGRVLRKHQYKSKARIVLFDTNQDDGELKYENYMRVMDKIDFGFRQDLKHKLKIYNYSHDYKFDLKIKEKENQYFDKIIHFRLTLYDKLKLCQEFYNENHRLPTCKEKYKNWNIGNFIRNIRYGQFKGLDQVKQIFGEHWIDIINKEYEYKEYEYKLKLCQEFYNENHRLPKNEEKYKEWNIGSFIHVIKTKNNKDKINDLKQIFKEHWIDGNINEYKYKQNLELCKRFYDEYHRLPKRSDKYKEWNIGSFIDTIKCRKNKDKINDLKQIFGEHWVDRKSMEIKYKLEDKLKLCQEFYNENHRLPNLGEKYKGFGIGMFIYDIKRTKNKDKIDDLKKIFGEHWIDGNIRDYKFQQNLELCKQFYDEHHRLPKWEEKYKEWNIGFFINKIRNSNNKNKIKNLEEIFHCKFD